VAASDALRRLVTPARPAIPHARWWKIAFRTAHLMATGILLGGHAFGAPPDPMSGLLWAAAITGGALILLEAGLTLHWLFEGWGALVIVKLAILALVPICWDWRLPLTLAAVALAAVGSHMAARYRHYSFLYRRVIKE
jgi:hypothetical protein